MINRDNYELYFIDLLDGTLSSETVDELLDFLRDNPDLAAELKGLENIKVEAEEVESFNYNHLLKSDLEQNGALDETCIRSIENDLSFEEEAEFKAYLATHPKARKHFKLFQSTISVPDLFIVYKNKESLKRKNKILPLWYAAAAVVVLGLITWFMLPQATNDVQIARVEVPVEPLKIEIPEVEIDQQQLISEPEKIELAQAVEAIQEPAVKAEPIIKEENFQVERIDNLPTLAFVEVQVENQLEPHDDMALVKLKVQNKSIERPYYPTVPELIAQEVNKIDAKREARKLGRYALDRLADFSDDKLTFATNKSGQVRKIEYNSRLLAFSVPVNSKDN